MKRDLRIFAFGGLGGLICGIDFGIVAVAVPYMRSLGLYSDAHVGWIVGGVMLGGILASACGGWLCDHLGRRSVVRLATACFLASIPTICLSGVSFSAIMTGRILQGMFPMLLLIPLFFLLFCRGMRQGALLRSLLLEGRAFRRRELLFSLVIMIAAILLYPLYRFMNLRP